MILNSEGFFYTFKKPSEIYLTSFEDELEAVGYVHGMVNSGLLAVRVSCRFFCNSRKMIESIKQHLDLLLHNL